MAGDAASTRRGDRRGSLLGSRVGRRLVLLFAICALIPLLSLAGLSRRAVRSYLQQAAVADLRIGSKAYAMSLVDRLDIVEVALRDLARSVGDGGPTKAHLEMLSRRLDAVGLLASDGRVRRLVGTPGRGPRLMPAQRAAALSGKAVILGADALWMAVAAGEPAGDEILIGRVGADFLWWGVTRENTMPADTSLAVVANGAVIFSTVATPEALLDALASSGEPRDAGLRWEGNDGSRIAGYWKVPLGIRFHADDWTVIWSRPEAALLAPARRYERLFAVILAVTLLAVLILSTWQIRRFLVPLETLREGTRRISKRDFETPVEVATDDEFGDLATSFNDMARRLNELVDELMRHQLGTLRALARAIDERSSWTLGHSGRVARLANRIAQRVGMAPEDLWDLHRAALLHDIGKLSIEQSLLDRPGALTQEERQRLEQHVASGLRILEPIPGYDRIRPIVAQHHERLDGSGYPEGLAGDEIGLGARILAVADSFDALSSDRPYRAGLGQDEVLAELRRGSGTLYDPAVLRAMEELAAEGLAAATEPGGGELGGTTPTDSA